MTRPLLILLAGLSVVSAEDLTTTEGKTYTGYSVTKIEPDGLRITHASGTAKVPFEKLSNEIQKRYGYDPFNAYDHEQAEKAKQSAMEKAESARARAVQAERDQAKKQADAAKRKQAEIDIAKSWGHMMQFSQNDESGLVIDGTTITGVSPPTSKSSRGLVAILAKGTPAKVAIMKGKTKVGEKDGWKYSRTWTPSYVDGHPESVSLSSRNDKIRIDGEALVYPIGKARFFDRDGNKKTLPRFTQDLEVAVKFYAKNGSPGPCDNVVTDFSAQAQE
jgi:hypothetical protein